MRQWLSGNVRGQVAALLVSLAGAGLSAHADLSSFGSDDRAVAAGAAPKGYEADDHFPGAALFTAIDDGQAASGTTGTTTLPDLALADAAVLDDSVRAAAPFVLRGSAVDRARALQCLTDAIYYEAALEPVDGQRAVAQVVLNRVRHPAFPATVCGVVFQGSARAGCQFSFACDGAMARPPERIYWDRARAVAAQALRGTVFAPVGLATHYHTFAVKPEWNRALVMTGVFGAHFFHRWKGWWGTAAAFRQSYVGHEPSPGPPAPMPPVVLSAPVVEAGAPLELSQEPPIVPNRAAQSNQVRDNLPESQVLDKWRDSGKPLR